jgi:hypothetical protein
MSRFNGHFDSKFHGCMIVGRLADESRKRTITVYALHDDRSVVGLYDGVDVWIGSTSQMNKDIQQRMAEVERGAVFEIESGQTRRRLHDASGVMGFPKLEPFKTASLPRKMAKTGLPRRMAHT